MRGGGWGWAMSPSEIAALDAQVRAALSGCEVEPTVIDQPVKHGFVGRMLWMARDRSGRRFKVGHSPGRGRRSWDAYGPLSGAYVRGRTLGDVAAHLGPAPDGPQQLGLFGGSR